MARLWLPIGRPATTPPHDDREALMREFNKLGVYVAGAEAMEVSQLRDLLAWQKERMAEAAKVVRPEPRMGRAEVMGRLREHRAFLKDRQDGRKGLY